MRLPISSSLWLWSYLAPFQRYRDLFAKIAYVSHPSLIWRPRSLCPIWNFALKLTMRKLESWSYPPVKTPRRAMIVAQVILTQCQRVTNRSTDRQTDGFTIASTALCIASYADALWKYAQSKCARYILFILQVWYSKFKLLLQSCSWVAWHFFAFLLYYAFLFILVNVCNKQLHIVTTYTQLVTYKKWKLQVDVFLNLEYVNANTI